MQNLFNEVLRLSVKLKPRCSIPSLLRPPLSIVRGHPSVTLRPQLARRHVGLDRPQQLPAPLKLTIIPGISYIISSASSHPMKWSPQQTTVPITNPRDAETRVHAQVSLGCVPLPQTQVPCLSSDRSPLGRPTAPTRRFDVASLATISRNSTSWSSSHTHCNSSLSQFCRDVVAVQWIIARLPLYMRADLDHAGVQFGVAWMLVHCR